MSALEIDRYAVMGWSSGAPGALACGAVDPDRVAAVGVAAGQVPIEADDDPDVRDALGPAFAARDEIAATMAPDEFARTVAPLVAPAGLTLDVADELLIENKPATYLAELRSVAGLRERLAEAMAAAVANGTEGVELDLRLMVSPLEFDLASVKVPVRLWYGSDDAVFGPACGRWLAARLPHAQLEIVDGTSHLLPLLRWTELLRALVSAGSEK
jgi:pimeloyl-ACP methyl ester carboxylesterase